MNVILSGLIGAILGGYLSFRSNKDNLNDSLDSKSGWRKQLFDVASKSDITTDDVYRVRASLRYKKHKNSEELIPFSFDWMSNLMIYNCEHLVNDKSQTSWEKGDSEIIRIFCRYLLKNHWEYRASMGPKTTTSKQNYNSIPQKHAIETVSLCVKELNLMKDKYLLDKIEKCDIDIEIKKEYDLGWWGRFAGKVIGILSFLLILGLIAKFIVFNEMSTEVAKSFIKTNEKLWILLSFGISVAFSFFITPAKPAIKRLGKTKSEEKVDKE